MSENKKPNYELDPEVVRLAAETIWVRGFVSGMSSHAKGEVLHVQAELYTKIAKILFKLVETNNSVEVWKELEEVARLGAKVSSEIDTVKSIQKAQKEEQNNVNNDQPA